MAWVHAKRGGGGNHAAEGLEGGGCGRMGAWAHGHAGCMGVLGGLQACGSCTHARWWVAAPPASTHGTRWCWPQACYAAHAHLRTPPNNDNIPYTRTLILAGRPQAGGPGEGVLLVGRPTMPGHPEAGLMEAAHTGVLLPTSYSRDIANEYNPMTDFL